MKIAANYALGVAYYKYKTLISFKIYVVLYQYQSTQFKKYKLLNDNSSESVIAKSSDFQKNMSDGQCLISLIAQDIDSTDISNILNTFLLIIVVNSVQQI